MANTPLFSSITSKLLRTESTNEAGGRAYALAPKHALAQMAATGCFNGVFYASAESQLDEMRKLIDQVDDNAFLAKLAVYALERAYMKDMSAALHQAAEIGCGNVPELPGPVVIGLDTSGSMSWQVTGHRGRGRPRKCVASMWRPCSRRRSCGGTRTAS